MKKPLIILAVIAGLCIVGYIAYLIGFNYFISPTGKGEQEEIFKVEKGWTHSTVARKLADKGYIRNWFIYSIYVKLYREDAKVYPGKFKINNGMNINELIDTLNVSQVKPQVEVTIPEGKTSFEIANIFETELDIDKKRFIELVNNKEFIAEVMKEYPVEVNNLEGLLFPDKYKFPKEYEEEKIIKKMVGNFFDRFSEEITKVENIGKELEKIKPLNFQKMLTLASLVEKETASDKERAVVAGVYFNRIKTPGWVLNADPTVIYGLMLANKWQGDLKTSLGTDPKTGYINWKAFNSPYNTYTREGLPPTAISNPGIESIKASMNPEKTEYFFFVAKNDGSREHYFAKTLSEHNKNVAKASRNGQ